MVRRDEEERLKEARQKEAVLQAKELLILCLFLLASTVALRFVLLKAQRYDVFASYRVPLAVVEQQGLDPPSSLPIEPLVIPLPEAQ